MFATPQAVDLGQLCAAHGIAHECIDDWQQRGASRGQRLPAARAGLRTDRKADVRTLQQLFASHAITDTDLGLIRKYNRPGPRYTSYPPANHFREYPDPPSAPGV